MHLKETIFKLLQNIEMFITLVQINCQWEEYIIFLTNFIDDWKSSKIVDMQKYLVRSKAYVLMYCNIFHRKPSMNRILLYYIFRDVISITVKFQGVFSII